MQTLKVNMEGLPESTWFQGLEIPKDSLDIRDPKESAPKLNSISMIGIKSQNIANTSDKEIPNKKTKKEIDSKSNDKNKHQLKLIMNLVKSIKVPENLNEVIDSGKATDIRILLCFAVEKSIKDIILAVWERSYKIASQTTKELVIKDFTEEEKKDNTYHIAMATNLSGNLALVTCREPLRITLTSTISESIKSVVKDQTKADHTVKEIVSLNLDLGCQMVMKIIRSKTKSQIENDKDFID